MRATETSPKVVGSGAGAGLGYALAILIADVVAAAGWTMPERSEDALGLVLTVVVSIVGGWLATDPLRKAGADALEQTPAPPQGGATRLTPPG